MKRGHTLFEGHLKDSLRRFECDIVFCLMKTTSGEDRLVSIKENAATATNGVTPASDGASALAVSGSVSEAGASASASTGVSGFVEKFTPLWPVVLGLAFARGGLIVAGYGSYLRSDEGIYTDGAMMITIAIMAILAVVFYVMKLRVRKRIVNIIARACILTHAATLVLLVALGSQAALPDSGRLALCTIATLSSSFCQFYWIRRVRGCSSLTAAAHVFLAFAVSEVEIYICALLGNAGFYVAAVLVLVQFPLMLSARKQAHPDSLDSYSPRSDYFGFAKDSMQSGHLLVATGTSLGSLFVVVGFLRGYPDGTSIAFEPVTRLVYGLLTICICLVIVALVSQRRSSVTNVGMFVLFEILAAIALVLYAAFPERLDIGAVFTTTLNALMCAFMWYITISFVSAGWRDPYYYCLGGWVACMGSRCVARVVFIVTPILEADDLLVNAIMGMLLVFSVIVSLGQFLAISRAAGDRRERAAQARISSLEQQLSQAREANVVMVGAGVGASGEETGCAACEAACVDAADIGPTLADILPHENDANGGAPAHPYASRLQRIMGLDDRPGGCGSGAGGADVAAAAEVSPQEHTKRRAGQMGKQFMLSDREVEVLSLYALGWTQKRVAEELFISPATAHAHIKRIYAKTDLHSRQEILDYMEQYTE